ncbi:MAG: type II secretion system F family protein [Parvularculaceae bacterium]
MDPQILIAVGLVVTCVGALGLAFSGSNPSQKTNKRIARFETRDPIRRATGGGGQRDGSQKDRRKKLTETLAKLEEETKAAKKKTRVSLAQSIEQAGLSFSVTQFWIGSAVTAVVFGLIGFVSGQTPLVTGGLVFVGGLGLPRWFVGMAKARRQKKFTNEFSNAIDVIVRGVKSGLPVNECLKIIAKEAPAPVNEEFYQVTEGLRIGLSLEQTLDRFFDRMPLQEVRFFGIVLLIQSKTGGNLGEALGNLAGVLRGRKLMEGKIKALSSEAKASAMIIGALPFLVGGAVHMASPDYLAPLYQTQTGQMVLICSGVWMLIGIFVMRQMTQIKV